MKPGRLIHSAVFLFSKINLAVIVPFSFHINSRINLVISIKNIAGMLMGIGLNLYLNWGRTDIFSWLNLPICEHRMSLRLFVFLSFIRAVSFSVYKSYIRFVRFTPTHFNFFGQMINRIVFLSFGVHVFIANI